MRERRLALESFWRWLAGSLGRTIRPASGSAGGEPVPVPPAPAVAGTDPSGAGELPPLTLAYVGDGVYELYIRSLLVSQGMTRVANLHAATVQSVRAPAQAASLTAIEPFLTPEEAAIVRRGRNAKPAHLPRNSDGMTYHRSTAFEALIGFLYLSGQTERLRWILEKAGKTE